jgi:hypothetical protein
MNTQELTSTAMAMVAGDKGHPATGFRSLLKNLSEQPLAANSLILRVPAGLNHRNKSARNRFQQTLRDLERRAGARVGG